VLLVTLTAGTTTLYLSDQWHDIEHFYDGYIASISEMKISPSTEHGGFCRLSYGDMEVLMTAFKDVSFPLPRVWTFSVKSATTGEPDAVVMVEGTAYLGRQTRSRAVFNLYGPQYEQKWPSQSFLGTVKTEMAKCATQLGLTLDDTDAGSAYVEFDTEDGALVTDAIDTMASSSSHLAYIEGSTLYLVNMLQDAGSTLDLTEFDMYEPEYIYSAPYKEYTSKYRPRIKKYRFLFTDTQGSTSTCAIAELRLYVDGDEKDQVSPGGSSSASSAISGHPASSAFDNYADDTTVSGYTDTTYWEGTFASGQVWLQFDFSVYKEIDRFKIRSVDSTHASSLAKTPIAGKVLCWDENNSIWKKVGEFECDPDWEVDEERTFNVNIEDWELKKDSTYPFAEVGYQVDPICATRYSYQDILVGNVKTILEMPIIAVKTPIEVVPKLGQRIEFTDYSTPGDVDVWCRATAITWDISSGRCITEGRGGMA